MKAPEFFETDRLVLQRPRATDLEAIFTRYASDPDVTRFVAWPRHKSLADTEAFLAFSDAEWDRWRAGPYILRSRADGTLLGSTGLAGTTPCLALNGTSTKLLAAVGKGIYVADISQPYGPHELIEAIMSFVDASVADGTLEGVGPTKTSAAGKLHALRNMLENAEKLINSNSLEASCEQLLDAYKKTDGAVRPPDLVKGTGAPKLATMIQALMDTLACQ